MRKWRRHLKQLQGPLSKEAYTVWDMDKISLTKKAIDDWWRYFRCLNANKSSSSQSLVRVRAANCWRVREERPTLAPLLPLLSELHKFLWHLCPYWTRHTLPPAHTHTHSIPLNLSVSLSLTKRTLLTCVPQEKKMWEHHTLTNLDVEWVKGGAIYRFAHSRFNP